jgi:hypothetical protein
VWIALVAFALIGIVTLQLGLLELNTHIGRELERQGKLERENAALSIQNSELAAGETVEAGAHALGMRLVPAGALRFLRSSPGGDVRHAASVLASASTVTHASGSEATSVQATSGGEASSGEASASEAQTSAAEPGSAESHGTEARPSEATVTPSSEASHSSGAEAGGESSSSSGGSSEAAASPEASATAAGGTGAGPGG